MQRIIVHKTGCPELAVESNESLHVACEEMGNLVTRIFGLMQKYRIPFYQVIPHNQSCPGHHFPWEDLEFQLFELEH